MTNTRKYVLYVIAAILVLRWVYAILPKGWVTAGELLDQEIQMQKEKQTYLDAISVLDTKILEIRAKRNELQKAEVCAGSGCYIGF